MNGVHCRNGALNEIGRTPAERLKICKNMHVADMDASEAAQIFVNLRPRSARLICCKTLAVVLVHGVKILIQWQRCVHNHLAVGIVSADKDRRLVGAAEFLQSVLNAGDDGLCKPLNIVVVGVHCLAKAYEQTYVAVFLNKGGYALSGVVAK